MHAPQQQLSIVRLPSDMSEYRHARQKMRKRREKVHEWLRAQAGKSDLLFSTCVTSHL